MSVHLDLNDYTLLNALCHTYNAGLGYYKDEAILNEPNPLLMWKDKVEWIMRIDPDKNCDVVYNFNLAIAKNCAQNAKIPHSEVVIRLCEKGKRYWDEKPDDVTETCFDADPVQTKPVPWYELPERTTANGSRMLGPLSTRKYINVTDYYEEVVISRKEKGHKITLDDILFASRALCVGPDRSSDKYTIIKDSKGVLTLLARIDNWSY